VKGIRGFALCPTLYRVHRVSSCPVFSWFFLQKTRVCEKTVFVEGKPGCARNQVRGRGRGRDRARRAWGGARGGGQDGHLARPGAVVTQNTFFLRIHVRNAPGLARLVLATLPGQVHS
jgi:hypothetical protein